MIPVQDLIVFFAQTVGRLGPKALSPETQETEETHEGCGRHRRPVMSKPGCMSQYHLSVRRDAFCGA